MSKHGNRYAAEFRRQMVELVRAGRGPEELAREFEPSAQTIRNWVNQADLDEGRRQNGLTSEERAELRRLRRENRQLRLEREILSKAAAWFARETESVPPKRPARCRMQSCSRRSGRFTPRRVARTARRGFSTSYERHTSSTSHASV